MNDAVGVILFVWAIFAFGAAIFLYLEDVPKAKWKSVYLWSTAFFVCAMGIVSTPDGYHNFINMGSELAGVYDAPPAVQDDTTPVERPVDQSGRFIPVGARVVNVKCGGSYRLPCGILGTIKSRPQLDEKCSSDLTQTVVWDEVDGQWCLGLDSIKRVR